MICKIQYKIKENRIKTSASNLFVSTLLLWIEIIIIIIVIIIITIIIIINIM